MPGVDEVEASVQSLWPKSTGFRGLGVSGFPQADTES